MDVNGWIPVFSHAYATAGKQFSPALRELLFSLLPKTRTPGQLRQYADAKDIMIAYFFEKVSRSEVFGNPDRVRQQFGKTVEENYGLASGPFITLARTFWTFKIELNDLLPLNARLAATQTLLVIEQELASIFFPTPGPLAIPVQKRIDAQRAILTESVPGFDVEQFLSESPILRTGSRRQRAGCIALGLAILAFAICAVVSFGS